MGNGDATWFATVGSHARGRVRGADGEPVELEDRATRFQPTVFLYDNFPGGIGLSAPLFELRARAIDGALELVAACNCSDGCPACVGPILAAGAEQAPKRDALAVLRLLAVAPRA